MMGRLIVHFVPTDGKPADLTFEKWQRENSIRYVDKEKVRELSTTYGILASVVQKALRTNPKILTSNVILKPRIQK